MSTGQPDASQKSESNAAAGAGAAAANATAAHAAESMSLEDLDKVIAAADPNFAGDMSNIKEVGADNQVEIDSLTEVNEQDNLPESTSEVPEADAKISVKQKIKNKINAFKLRLVAGFKEKIARTVQFLKHELPERLKYLKSILAARVKQFAESIKIFKKKVTSLTRTQWLGVLFVLLSTVASMMILSKVFTGELLPRFTKPLVGDLAERASVVMKYNTAEDLQDLFQAFPEVEFYVLLKKVIVNLKPNPDGETGKLPMGAFEIYLALDAKETAIEVKDRELELVDAAQRVIEAFTYQELNSNVGKVRMKSALRERFNQALNQGRVMHIYFNTFILKP